MKSCDHDLQRQVEDHANADEVRVQAERYAEAMAKAERPCKQKFRGCTGKATTEAYPNWPTCASCARKMSQ